MALERNQVAKEEAIKVPLELADNFEVLLGKLKETIKTLGAVNAAFSKNPGLKESRENIQKLAKAQTDLAKTETELVKQHKLLADAAIKEEKAAQERLKTSQQEQKAAQARIKTEVEAQKVIQAKARTQQQAAKEAERLSREEEKAAKASEKLRIAEEKAAQPLARLNKLRNEAQLRLKNLIAAEELHGRATKQSTAQIQKAQLEFNKLDKAYIRVQRSARQFNDNVGNYPQLFGSATQALKGFVGAFGLIGGVQLFARVVTDAFKRVRDFDKEVVNLAAIAGTTRPNIKSLEKEIIRVAGTSIKTANEVAALATELIKLGSTTEEAEKLIKPVNDFSIALRAGADESAAFLKGVLNAFGVGAEEAGRFGDVLSKAANRSALDFAGLNDSFGYVAPTARQLGISVENLAAQIGTLADNNIAASRAGRLLNTSFARLVSQGKTLEGALEEIRNSTDKVKTATDLFGAESFTIGLILADNKQKVADLTKEFENSRGTLEELTNKQLESLDAKLKILDSTWESLILSFENGEGAIGKTTSLLVDFAASVLQGYINIQKVTSSDYIGFFRKLAATANGFIPFVSKFVDLNKDIVKEVENIDKAISETLEGVDTDLQFGFKGANEQQLRGQIDNIRFFQKELVKNLTGLGIEFDRATEIAEIWGDNTVKEFSQVAFRVKAPIEDIEEELSEAEQFLNGFANAISNLSVETLQKLKSELELLQAQKIALFDRTGNEGFKNEADEIAERIKLVGHAISALGDITESEIVALRPKFKSAFGDMVKDFQLSNDEITESTKKAMEEQVEAVKKAFEERIRLAEQRADAERIIEQETRDFTLNTISSIANAFIEGQQIRLENQLNTLSNIQELEETRLQNQIQNEEEGSQRRQLLEERLIKKKEEFAKRESQIRQRQAKLQKSQALIEIAINTARGVMQAYANVNPLVVAPLVALTIATGAVQAALVASQPLPQYAEGTEDSAKDFIAGEKGSEIVKEKSGKTHLTKGPTLFKNKPHSIVYNHDDTVRILNNSMLEGLRVNDRMPTYSDDQLRKDLNKGFKTLSKTIKSKPANIIQGRIIGGQVNGTRLRKINKYRGL